MKRKGISSEALVVVGVAFFAMAVIIFAIGSEFYGGPSGFINTFKNLIPSFKDVKVPQGATIVGVNLKTGELAYYDGSKWQNIDITKGPTLKLGRHEIKTDELKSDFYNFYIGERRPVAFLAELNNWRYLETLKIDSSLNGWDDVELFDKAKNGFSGYATRVLLDSNQNIFPTGGGFLLPPVALDTYSANVKQNVRAWVNQVFQGQPCEMFLKPDLNGQRTNQYAVKKIEPYIFVDLDKPITPGADEKWKNPNCFTSQYNDANVLTVNSYGLKVVSVYRTSFWKPTQTSYDYWRPILGNGPLKMWQKSSPLDRMSLLEENDLFLGLKKLFYIFYNNKDDFRDIAVYAQNYDKSGLVISEGKIFSVDKVESENDVYDLVYRALDAYNQQGVELYYKLVNEGNARLLKLGDKNIDYVAFTSLGRVVAGKTEAEATILGQVNDGIIVIADEDIRRSVAEGILTTQLARFLNEIKGKKFSDLENGRVITGTWEAYYGL